jgi:TonB family protein
MFRRQDHSLAAALCVSIVAHAGMMFILVGRALDARPRQPVLSRTLESRSEPASPIFLVHKPPPPADLLFGDPSGSGDAANASPGEQPMTGRYAGEVQAFLSRDPAGAGEIGDDPAMSILPRGVERSAAEGGSPPPSGAAGAPAVETATANEMERLSVIGVRSAETAPLVRREIPVRATKSLETASAEQAPRLNEMAARSDDSAAAQQTSSMPAADPAMMSDSESDPFAHASGTIEFRDGRVDVRFGRKVKTVRPRLSLAAHYDLMAMQCPRMVVRLQVEASGAIRDVNIVTSSGSRSADQEVKVALYQWWIEPPKDKRGAALADVVEFPILWR